MSWKLNAACRGLPPDMFYRHAGESREDWEDRQRAAKAVCVLCVVRPICLEAAWLGGEDRTDSIWGGLDDAERRREWKRRTGRRYPLGSLPDDGESHPADGTTGDAVPGVRPSLN